MVKQDTTTDPAMTAVANLMGARGGHRRGARMTAAERSASAAYASLARWTGKRPAVHWRDLLGKKPIAATGPKRKKKPA
jgi:hypothetical protein